MFKTYKDFNQFANGTPKDMVFTGNDDGSSIKYAYLKHSYTARYVRVLPRLFVGRIAMRVDIIGCGDHARTDCTSSASFVFDKQNSNHVTGKDITSLI